ncbi:MvdC/MvdD family ATP grasp protein [Nannocystis pusilla]|uniref:MvdC/MvdD family ATP grasp protein n=1 Tax=Nannocystis pusilla TaxID=889268 RepID=UPI003B7B8D73
MIIILTGPTDPHADAVIERLERRGAEYLRFDEADYPARANLSFGCAPDGRTATILRTQERSVDLERVSTIWRRRPSPRSRLQRSRTPRGGTTSSSSARRCSPRCGTRCRAGGCPRRPRCCAAPTSSRCSSSSRPSSGSSCRRRSSPAIRRRSSNSTASTTATW